MPEGVSARRYAVRLLGGRHRGVRLTGRELDLGGHPAPPDPAPPRTRPDQSEQPAGFSEPACPERVGRETEQSVRSGTVRVDTVRIAPTGRPNARESGSIEWASEVMRPELTVVRRARRERKGRDHRVGVVTERIQHGGRRRVVPLATEHHGSEPSNAGVGGREGGPDVAIG
ncbi:hypothetical protein GCM10022267_58490 [Lentzea roselyniae]|uniref:Uncharacterized protein n=1 Tax=Lentzea roselyniae TaxID=531940 RepID=A0ABP7BP44_9PSEU